MFPELGDAPAWTEESLQELDARNIEYNGKLYTQYEISQMQRARERNVRKWKKRYLAEDAAGLDTTDSAVRLKAARQSLSEFAKATGGRVDSARVSVPKFGRSEASRASAKSQAHHTEWLKSINAQSTNLNTVAKYYNAKYNNTEEYQLLSKYSYSVQQGNISPIAGFDNYMSGYHRIETVLVGKKTSSGLEITGQSMHFMERVLGTINDPKTGRPRDGVEVDDIISCVLTGATRGIKYDAVGRSSILYFSDKCAVSINPDTGELIQCNPFFR